MKASLFFIFIFSVVLVTARRPLVDFHQVQEDASALRSNSLNIKGLLPDAVFGNFVAAAAECANKPINRLKYRSSRAKESVQLGSNKVEKVWLTSQPRDINDITLCTQLDRTRLHMLRGQCNSWGGPMSVTVYLSLKYLATVDNAEAVASLKKELDALHAEAEETGACALDMVLISELISSDASWAYPYNANRNQAIARARTRLVLLLDADFLPSAGMRESLLDPKAWRDAIQATHVDKHILVMPAFETKTSLTLDQGTVIANQAAAATKSDLYEMFDADDVVQFAPFFQRGHGATNYSRWFKTDRPYMVFPEVGYEPFVVVSRLHIPPFDERFRGYGWDKQSFLAHLNETGFQFVVHPDGWVVHRPHAPSEAYAKSFTGPSYTKKHKGTQELRKLNQVAQDMLGAVKEGSYPKRGVTVLAGCGPVDLLHGITVAKAETNGLVAQRGRRQSIGRRLHPKLPS